MTALYVYGLTRAGTDLPADLTGLGPSGRVWTVPHGELAAIVSDVPVDRPLGTRDDLVAHEAVLDAVAASAAVVPMRFPAVIESEGIVEELLGPYQEEFLSMLADLEGRVQFTVKGRYEQDVVLRELLERDQEIRGLQEKVRDLPEDASYYDRVRLGELIVRALEEVRDGDAARMLQRLEGKAVATQTNSPPQPDDVVNAAFLVDRGQAEEFEAAVEDLGREYDGRVRFRLLGPLAPYDFLGQE